MSEITLTLSVEEQTVLRKALISGLQFYNTIIDEYDHRAEMDAPPPRNCTSEDRARWERERQFMRNLQTDVLAKIKESKS